ncbi:MFS general substrate transporter [Lizonia empirigonia]|nr:MFS general substrate transporter [Lizonia empirigonia]
MTSVESAATGRPRTLALGMHAPRPGRTYGYIRQRKGSCGGWPPGVARRHRDEQRPWRKLGAARPTYISCAAMAGCEMLPSSGHATNLGHQSQGGRQASVAAKLRNPLAGLSEEQVIADVDAWCLEKGLVGHQDAFRKGTLIARMGQRDDGYEYVSQLSEEEKNIFRNEQAHRWSQPFMLYFLVVLCAGSAIVQGMYQTAVNGAQLQGLLNGAPYLCSALIGCWCNAPMNKYFGRRGTIFISCIISFITGIWMAAANNWVNLLIARFALGFAVGAKSSTTPVYAAESAPKIIRGALTMMWQMWTAFGIMLGFVVSVAFQNTTILGEGSQWRWMLASTSIPPLIVCLQVYFCPESPRWYMEKGKFDKAFDALCRLRNHKIQATRDMYYAYKLLKVEQAERAGKSLWKEFFFVRRNRRAAQSSFFVMFMQQFCGCLGSIAAAIYTFMAVYSPSEGPVPFTYAAEAFPLHLRDLGMSFATATCWGFNFILSLTWPALVEAFTPPDAFGWYAAWNFAGWVYCYFLLPEIRNLTLEELDTVFDVGNVVFAGCYAKKLPWYLRRNVLRSHVEPFPVLVRRRGVVGMGRSSQVPWAS